MFVRQNKKFSIEGNKMKKFSSLCLALVLSFSGLFNLIANANAASGKISFKGLNTPGIVGAIEDWQMKFNYTYIESYFVSLLEEMGEVETARLYEDYRRQNQFDDLLRNPENYIEFYDAEDLQRKLNDEIRSRACAFFNQFTFALSNPKEVVLYALIHNDSFEAAVEFLALIHKKTFEEAMEEIWIS